MSIVIILLSNNVLLVSIHNILGACILVWVIDICLGVTLIIIISSDWNKEGFAAGSSTVDEDWNDWNSPAISRDKAKLFLKRI